jgi:glycosyltransferase involved in cell wall biosynthesis
MAKLPQSPQPKIVAGLAAYNEEKYIGSVVLRAQQYVDEVIVVDDGSIDQTSKVARLAGATVIKHESNQGKGVSIQTILAEARSRAPDILVLLDADSQHDPDDIPALVKPITEGIDLVVGSRKEEEGKAPLYRRIGRRALLYSTRVLARKDLTDSESGFRALSGKALFELQLKEKGFAIESEMIASAADRGLKIAEVPIRGIYTRDGSTLNPIRHGVGVLARITAMISEKRPLLFFGLAGGVSTVLGLVAGVRVLQIASSGGGVATGSALLSVLLLTIGIFSVFTGIILNALTRRRS